jgi:hypothetical protein
MNDASGRARRGGGRPARPHPRHQLTPSPLDTGKPVIATRHTPITEQVSLPILLRSAPPAPLRRLTMLIVTKPENPRPHVSTPLTWRCLVARLQLVWLLPRLPAGRLCVFIPSPGPPPPPPPTIFNVTATTEIYTLQNTLSLHDALPICSLYP